jgi:AhpD family alkylhydroperoxidase
MRTPFTLLGHNVPAESQSLLAALHASRGMTTNLERAIAASPALLTTYTQIMTAFEQASFTAIERQVILLAISTENACDYCAAWHTALALRTGLPAASTQALRNGDTLSDARLEALRRFAVTVAQQRGHVSDDALASFLQHGWNAQQALEVIVGIGAKTLSNYAGSLMRVELDRAVEKFSQPHAAVSV